MTSLYSDFPVVYVLHPTHRVIDVRDPHQPGVVEGGIEVLGGQVLTVQRVDINEPEHNQ